MEHMLDGEYFPAGSHRDSGTEHDPARAGANAGNQCAASKQLGIHRNTLQRKMEEYGLGNGSLVHAASRSSSREGPPAGESSWTPDRPASAMASTCRPPDGPSDFRSGRHLIDSRLDLGERRQCDAPHMGMRRSRTSAYIPMSERRAGADPPRVGRPGHRGGGPGGTRVFPGVLSRTRTGLHHPVSRGDARRSTGCARRASGWRC